jgi:hypothetical protein
MPAARTAPATKKAKAIVRLEFQTWLSEINAKEKYDKNVLKFGQEVSKLIWSPQRSHGGFHGFTKDRTKHGMVYAFDIPLMVQEMTEKKWLLDDDIPARAGFIPE